MRLSFRLAIPAILLAASLAAHADTVYSTFGPGQTYDTSNAYVIGLNGPLAPAIASPFVPTETVTLTDAILAMSQISGNSPVNVYIESSSGGAPGSILDTLSQVGSLTSAPSLLDFVCVSCSVLDAGTMYFIVAQQSNVFNRSGWQLSLGPNTTIYFSEFGSATGPWFSLPDSAAGAFEVNGTLVATPEPSSIALLGTGLLALAGMARRRFSHQ